ncbi:hypothetical protein [Actinoplanes derwentensis]|uniref:Tetratricopeptide repeat-containing protein n=1 Tax=Actinoplanes derwentensis TaxID=113562 RepID=A0A1H2DDK1_9ACTN|nr:hypothetical protein [Actinoplanes derwentensis]GID89635.1 hypothetical protein Ade03nite_85590 [Actinoplanes derwentensis]SDT80664.1 hypothetical protein SAMN04489716_9304 [Actinoplanes derwentensis]
MHFDLTDMILAMDDDRFLLLLNSWEDPHDPRTDHLLGVLPAALLQRCSDGGRLELLDRAIPLFRAGATDPGIDAEVRSSFRANLVTALRLDYERTGRAAILEDAIAEAQSLSEEPASGDEIAGRLATLARLYALRAEGFNSPGDVTRAIDALEQAVDVPGISAEKAAACWSDLAGAWRTWEAMCSGPDVLRQIRSAMEEAVRLDPSVINRVNLTSAQRLCAVAAGDVTELAESIIELGVIAEGQDEVGAHVLHNLGRGHTAMFTITGSSVSRDAAVAALRGAFAATPAGYQSAASIAVDLAEALLLGPQRAEDEALRLLDLASEHPAATVLVRFNAATTAASLRPGADALDRWRRAVALLPLLAWRGSRYRDRESAVARFAGVARSGTACAAGQGMPREAIGMLETGRSLLWSQLLETRADLHWLGTIRPDLAEQLARVRRELDRTHHT